MENATCCFWSIQSQFAVFISGKRGEGGVLLATTLRGLGICYSLLCHLDPCFLASRCALATNEEVLGGWLRGVFTHCACVGEKHVQSTRTRALDGAAVCLTLL